MVSFAGAGKAAVTIVLAFAGLAGFVWIIGTPGVIERLNGWVLLGGFVLLLLGALVAIYMKASRKSAGAPAAGIKAVGMQLLQIVLILAGMLGLVILLGTILH